MAKMKSFLQFLEQKEDPCWDGYQQYGMKKKNGKQVPNCVPKEEYKSDAQRKAVWASRNEKGIKEEEDLDEATYKGREVPLNKPMSGDVKKSKVYVDPDGDGKAKKVEFGDPNMTIKKNNPARRKSFRARHGCDDPSVPKPKDKARYWSCKAW
jgi:hypothetical protein